MRSELADEIEEKASKWVQVMCETFFEKSGQV